MSAYIMHGHRFDTKIQEIIAPELCDVAKPTVNHYELYQANWVSPHSSEEGWSNGDIYMAEYGRRRQGALLPASQESEATEYGFFRALVHDAINSALNSR